MTGTSSAMAHQLFDSADRYAERQIYLRHDPCHPCCAGRTMALRDDRHQSKTFTCAQSTRLHNFNHVAI